MYFDEICMDVLLGTANNFVMYDSILSLLLCGWCERFSNSVNRYRRLENVCDCCVSYMCQIVLLQKTLPHLIRCLGTTAIASPLHALLSLALWHHYKILAIAIFVAITLPTSQWPHRVAPFCF